MLYIRDLRGLQSTIDQTLVDVQVMNMVLAMVLHSMHQLTDAHLMQNYTANPKTDAALGRIGR